MTALVLAALLLPTALQNLIWLRLDAHVDRVVDGNNVRVHDHNNYLIQICLLGSDAPELGQPVGVEARNRLRELIEGRDVVVVHRFVDVAGRTLGSIYIDSTWVNRLLVEEGLAWYFDPYNEVPQLKAFEALAKEQKKGLWQADRPIPPWFWRRGMTTWRDEMAEATLHVYPRFPSTNEPRGVTTHGL